MERIVEVGTHTGHVTHIVTYVVGNRSRVAGIVFRNVSLHLTHDVGTHVGSLRIDTAAHTCKQSLCGSTHTEGQHGGRDGYQGHFITMIEMIQNQEPDGNVEQAEAYHHQTHHGT